MATRNLSPAPSDRAYRASLIVLAAVNVLNFYDRHVLGALTEPVRKEFALSDAQVGWLATGFLLFYAVIGVPLGRLADVWSRKKLLAAGVALWSLLTGSGAIAASFTQLLVSRLGVAVGEAVCAPTATSWIGDLVPAARRARPLALFMLGVPVGGALSYFFAGPIAQEFGWRAAMALAAVPGLLFVPILLALREPPRGASEAPASREQTPSPWTVLRIPTLWWIIASGALVHFNLYVLAIFLPAHLSRVHGLSVGQAGVAMGALYCAGGLLGAILGGSLGDRAFRIRKDGRLLAAAAAATLAAPAAYFGIVQRQGSLAVTLLLLALAYGLFNVYYGPVYSSIQDVVASGLRATTMAIYFMLMYLGGASLGPVLTGSLSDWLARRAASAAGFADVTETFRAAGLQQAMLIIPVLSLLLGAVLFAGSRTIEADMEAKERLSARRE